MVRTSTQRRIPDIDVDKECFPAGQGAGAITELIPAGALVTRFVAEAEAALARVDPLR